MRYLKLSIIVTFLIFAAAFQVLRAEEKLTNKTAAELFSIERFRKMLGAKIDLKDYIPGNPAFSIEKTRLAELPTTFDWRDQGIIGNVRDQGDCGSCWAFATIGVFEALIKWKSGVKSCNLSEQQLVDCLHPDQDGCDGDYPYDAFEYLVEKGVMYESKYPYQAVDGACLYNNEPDYKLKKHWYDYLGYMPLDDQIKMLKTTIYTYGPCSVDFTIYEDFYYSYSGDVYTYDGFSDYVGEHAVVVVGWVDDWGGGYWICKNSWGASWGDNGYFYIAYGECGINDLYDCGEWSPNNNPPVFDSTIGNQSIREGSTLNISFTATDADGDTITYSASPLPGGASVNSSAGAFTWTPAYTQAGTYTIKFTASDGTDKVEQSATITVINVKYKK